MKYCSNCGKELNDDDLFCSKCGTKQIIERKCINCGICVGACPDKVLVLL